MLEIESLHENNDLERLNARKLAAEAIYGSDEDVAGSINSIDGWDFKGAETYTITKLTPGVKDQNRVNIFLNGHFVLSLEINQVVDFGLKVHQSITKKKLHELQRASEFGKLYQRSLEWVLTRPHSVRETRDYLRRRQLKRKQLNRKREREEKTLLSEFDDELIGEVLAKLINKGYVDNQKFAEFYVENRYLRKGISHKRLRMELTKKGVDPVMIDQVFAEIPRDEDEEIVKIIKRKRKKYNDFQLVGYLVRQGFSLYNAREAVERYERESEEG